MSNPSPARMPRQIPYIIGNEGCERFSFYGMKNILTGFVALTFFAHLPEKAAQAEAKDIYHIFVIGVYFFPLLGGWLSDRFFGKYSTIFWLSLVYCAGHACLSIFDGDPTGFYLGLGLIALGSGGIKPLVSSFVGDQFNQSNKHLAKKVYDAFYWIINFGSLFATLLMPTLLAHFGAKVAFGVPGLLMGVATVVFWAGRHKYVVSPPTPPDPNSFTRVVRTALLATVPGQGRPGLMWAVAGALVVAASPFLFFFTSLGFVETFCLDVVAILAFGGAGTWIQLERARGAHSDEAVDGARAVLRILIVFSLVTPFWSLFDQKASTWVLTAQPMLKPWWFENAHMLALNPLLVVLIIPFNNLVLYPWLKKRGIELAPLKKMAIGLFVAASSWVVIAIIQLVMDGGSVLTIFWQVIPYFLLTFGEVLVSATGLEFAYSQAPASMKGVIMSFWSLAVTIGNLWVLLVNTSIRQPSVLDAIAQTGLSTTAFLMFFFAAFAFLAAIAFAFYARHYKMVDHYRAGSAGTSGDTPWIPEVRVVKDPK
jgi:proton-dependent oligopeptide transporter, POT family